VFVSLADWGAAATNAIAWVPTGQTEDLGQTDGVTHAAATGAQASCLVAHWVNVAGGAVNYGVTAPTSTAMDIIVWEVLGTAPAALPPDMRVMSQAVRRASFY
jgi:hypothetical protein